MDIAAGFAVTREVGEEEYMARAPPVKKKVVRCSFAPPVLDRMLSGHSREKIASEHSEAKVFRNMSRPE